MTHLGQSGACLILRGEDYSCPWLCDLMTYVTIFNDPRPVPKTLTSETRLNMALSWLTILNSSLPISSNTNGKSSCSPLRPFGRIGSPIGPRSRSPIIAVFRQFLQHRSKDFLFNLRQHLVCANMFAPCKRTPISSVSNYTVYTCLHHYCFFLGVCRYYKHMFVCSMVFKLNGVLAKLLTAMVGCVWNGAWHPNGHRPSWGFPKMGVPLNHPSIALGFSNVNHYKASIFEGVPPILDPAAFPSTNGMEFLCETCVEPWKSFLGFLLRCWRCARPSLRPGYWCNRNSGKSRTPLAGSPRCGCPKG